MADDLKIQGEVSLDTTGADAAFVRVEQSAKKMAKGVTDAADSASKAIPSIGAGSDKAASTVDRATTSIIGSIQRTTAAMQAGEKGSAKYFEALASQRGANMEALRPYIAQLEEAKRRQDAAASSLNGMGMSAKATTAAMRQVPAQFTDIFVSLQGGQKPLTVLLQQGGQLKAVFGGIGPAARALGGYVLGLVNPFTIAAAAAGGLAYAYYKGSQEADAYAKALILTGNAAGTTVSQLGEMARHISTIAGTQGNAAEALSVFASGAKVGAANIEAFTLSAIRFERVTGQAVSETAKQFADLAKEPLAASLKLNDGMNYLTMTTYRQIKALEDQGRTTEAANLAQKTFADTLDSRSVAMQRQLGTIERSWLSIKDAIKGAADAVLDVGRKDSQLVQIRAQIAAAKIYGGDKTPGGKELLRGLEAQERAILGQAATEAKIAADQAKSAAQVKARAQADRDGLKYLDERKKMEGEIARQTATLKAAGADKNEIKARELAIRESFKNKLVDKDAQKTLNAANQDLERYRDLLDELAGKQDGFSRDFGEKLALIYRGAKANGDSNAVRDRAIDRLMEQQPFYIQQMKERAEAEKQWADARNKAYRDIQSQADLEVKAAQQGAKGAEDRVTALRDEEEAIQRSRLLNIGLAQAIEEVRIARLQDAIAQEQAKPDASQEKIDAIQKEIVARRELASLNEQKEKRDSANEDLKRFMKVDFNTDFSAGFDKSSQAAGTFVQTLAKLADAQERYNKVKSDSKASNAQLAAAEIGFQRQQISGYASLAGAAKGFFGEKTAGYKALQAAEMTLRAMELASAAQGIAATFAEGQAKAVTGVVNQANGDPYSAFPRMAAMAAIMAGLGFVVAGAFGGGGSGGPQVPLNNGTGTVFGDPQAQSKSITRAIGILSEVDTMTMRYSGQMLESLRNIENSLAGVTGQILRNGGAITGAGFVASQVQNNASLAKNMQIAANAALTNFTFGIYAVADKLLGGMLSNVVNGVIGGFFGKTKTSLQDSGLQFGAQSLGSVLSGGVSASGYQSIKEQKSALFGLSKSSKTYTDYFGIDGNLSNQFTNLIRGTYDSVIEATKALGINADETAKKLAGFTINLGRISLKDLNGEQIQERLTAVFGAFADSLAGAAASQFTSFQKTGEGYYETLIRVASGFEQAAALLDGLGVSSVSLNEVTRKQGDVAAELVRQSLLAKEGLTGVADVLRVIDGSAQDVADAYKSLSSARTDLKLYGLDGSAVGIGVLQGAGGLQALTTSLKAFEDGFLSDSAKITNQAERMSIKFKALGLSMPDSAQAFIALIKGIDTSTEAGKKLLGGVLGLSGGFSDLLGAIKDVGRGIADEIERIKGLMGNLSPKSMAQLQSDFAINTAQARAGDQRAIDLLPSISQALLKAAEATAGSSVDLAAIQARTLASLKATLAIIGDPTNRLGSIPGFASGGHFGGGWRLVGENGPEIEATGAARIFDAGQTARILRGGDGSLVSEVRTLRQELAALRDDQRAQASAIASNTGKAARILEAVTQDGMAVTTVPA